MSSVMNISNASSKPEEFNFKDIEIARGKIGLNELTLENF